MTWIQFNFRDIVVTTKRRLIEVRGDEREAVFQVVGESGKTETFKVNRAAIVWVSSLHMVQYIWWKQLHSIFIFYNVWRSNFHLVRFPYIVSLLSYAIATSENRVREHFVASWLLQLQYVIFEYVQTKCTRVASPGEALHVKSTVYVLIIIIITKKKEKSLSSRHDVKLWTTFLYYDFIFKLIPTMCSSSHVTHSWILLIYESSQSNLNKLQRIQNSLARVITNTSKYQHITPTLKKTTLASNQTKNRLQTLSSHIQNTHKSTTYISLQ